MKYLLGFLLLFSVSCGNIKTTNDSINDLEKLLRSFINKQWTLAVKELGNNILLPSPSDIDKFILDYNSFILIVNQRGLIEGYYETYK